jgi:glutamyl-tRNA synthetase
MKAIRTRIAPSPTGENLHIGNAYTALINYVFARKNRGQFLIRIEDTDRTRLVAGSEKRILESLKWLGIIHDEGPDIGGQFAPYRQSDRLPIYRQYVEKLVADGHAYYCFCTTERLEQMRKNQEANHQPPMYDGTCKAISPEQSAVRVKNGEKFVIRLNVPDTGITQFTDLIRGVITFENKLIDDQVLLKSDGYPTYHLGVVVDDHLMEISHIIRGEEWISSTPKHILLYDFFGWEKPVFAHMPLLRNPDKSKLSKRKNPVWASWYRDQGYIPEAVINYLATLAWANPSGKEIFTPDDMMKVFELNQIQTTAPIFNTEKLRWLNGEYLKIKSDTELIKLIREFDIRTVQIPENIFKQIIPLIRERMKLLSEFWQLAGFFIEQPKEFEKPLVSDQVKLLLKTLSLVTWKHDDMEHAIREQADKNGLKAKDIFMQLRIAITGKTVGPPLLESLMILGRDETIKRLKVT